MHPIEQASASQPRNWRSYFTRQRLRIFIALSIAAHLLLGMSWGVPAYLKSRRADAELRRQEALAAEQHKAADEAVKTARAKNLQQTAHDVAEQTRKQFDSITADLKPAEKEKTWSAVAPKIEPAERQLATALGDRTTTEQDLRNVQANLDRQLVEAVNTTFKSDSGREEIKAFLTAVETRVAPELINWYKDQLAGKVAQPVRVSADAMINTSRQSADKLMGECEAHRRALDESRNHLRDEVDGASAAADRARQLQARGAPQPEIAAQVQEAQKHLTAAASAGDAAAGAIAALNEKTAIAPGSAELLDQLATLSASLAPARQSIKTVGAALDGGNIAAASDALTALSLTIRRVDAEVSSALDSAGRLNDGAENEARGAVGALKDNVLPAQVNERLTRGFGEKASDRISEALMGAFNKRLAASGVKVDPQLIDATRTRVKALLEKKITDGGGYGDSTAQRLIDPAGSAPVPTGAAGQRLIEQFKATATPIISAGVDDVLADASQDARWASMVERPDRDLAHDDVRDRVAMLAAREADGRSGGISSVSLDDLRAGALSRAARIEQTGAPAQGGASATQPAEALPVVADVKKDLLDALKKDLQRVIDSKLPPEKTEKIWNQVAKASDSDVDRLSQDLIDPNVSDSDLESRRLEFSGKFLGSVHTALDKTAADEVSGEMLKQLQGQAGDAVAGAYKKAVEDHVGNAISRDWRNAEGDERRGADRRVRDIRVALNAARSLGDKSAQILDQVKDETARAVQEAKGDPKAIKTAIDAARGKLQQIASAVAAAKGDLEKAQKDVPAEAAELKQRLDEIGGALSKVDEQLAASDKTGEAGDAGTFDKSVADARVAVEKFRQAVQGGQEGLNQVSDQAEAKFAKAAEQSQNDPASGGAGVKSRVQEEFHGQFRKEALPRLTKQIVRDYTQKLDQAGVATDTTDQAELERAIADALDKKVTGEGHAGEAALANVQRQGVFDRAKNVKDAPTTQAVAHAGQVAEKATHEGVAEVMGQNVGQGEMGAMTGNLQGPSREIGAIKDKVSRMQGQLRGGRGGMLAQNADDNAADAPGSAAALRRKWRGALAGLGNDSGAGGAGRPGPAGAGGASAGVAAGGHGPLGPGVKHPQDYDEAQHEKLSAALKDRGVQQGRAMSRAGADGQAAQAEDDVDVLHPAQIVSAATQPASQAKNDQPYKPSFKSLQFAVVPFLNKPIVIGDNFDAWKDIPPLHLRPEFGWLADRNSVKIMDDLPLKMAWDGHGLYFMYEVKYATGKVTKNHADEFWYCDCLEVFIDTLNTKESRRGNGAGQQFWYWPFGSADDAAVPGGESIFSRQTGFSFVPLKDAELPRFTRPIPDGYQMQCRVPIERVRDADLAPGKILGFNITVETGTKLHYYWSASKVVGTSVHPDTWGDILLGGSDGHIEFPAKLVAEGDAKANEKTVSAFVVGEPLRIRVVDRDMNLNDRVKDKVSVTVRNSQGDQEVAILEETGADTGIFEGSVRTTLALGEHVPGSISAYEGESLSVTYIDQARGNGSRNAEVVSRIKGGPSVMVEAGK